MRSRTTAGVAVSGMLMGSASAVGFWALLGPNAEAPPAMVMEAVEIRGSLPPEPPAAAAVGGAAAIEGRSAIKAELVNGTVGMSLAMSTRVGSADPAMLEAMGSGAAWSPRSRAHLMSRAGTQAAAPGPEDAPRAANWLPAPPPAKPEPALASDSDRALERDQDRTTEGGVRITQMPVPAAIEGLDTVDQTGVAETLVRLPQRLASPIDGSKPDAAAVIAAALPPGADWAQALSETDLGDLRGAGVEQVVMEMTGDTTVNDATSEVDATMTLEPDGRATLDGTLPDDLSVAGEGVRVETVLDGMENFSGFAQVIQVPGNHNVVTANLLINMYILMNEGVLPPNLANLSSGTLP